MSQLVCHAVPVQIPHPRPPSAFHNRDVPPALQSPGETEDCVCAWMYHVVATPCCQAYPLIAKRDRELTLGVRGSAETVQSVKQ